MAVENTILFLFIRRANSLEKTLMLGTIEDKKRMGQQMNEIVRQHH